MKAIVRLSQLICALLVIILLLHLVSLAYTLWLGNQQFQLSGAMMQLALQVPGYSRKAWPVLQQLGYSQLWLSLPQQFFVILLNGYLLRLFLLYRQMVIFTPKNVQCFQHIGVLFMVWACWQVLYSPLLVTVVNQLHQQQHLRYLQVEDSQLMLLVTGLIVWATGRVMAYGLQLKQEQDLVI